MQNQIIQFLKKSDGYLSGEEISRTLKISRAGIWKYIQELRKSGYDIVAVPHLGYRLLASPDKLLPFEVRYQLNTKILGNKVIHQESLTSTMDIAFRLGMENEPEGTVVCAENQTKGKGRLGRSWVSPKGKGVYMSIILRPSMSPADVSKLTLLSAVAVCEAVNHVCDVGAKIKWPNDILVNDKKIAGILTELSAEMDRVRFVVVGVGVNVNTSLGMLPERATSLKIKKRKNISRVVLVQEILRHLERWYMVLQSEGFTPVTQRWKQLSSTLGQRIRIADGSGEIEGEAIDLDQSGGLVIRNDMGMTVKRITGDVIQIR